MAIIKTVQQSFGGGELTPEFWGRLQDAKFQTGLAQCRNFIVLPHGPITNRPGFAFVREVKNSAKKVRLISFTYSTDQTMVIEVGEGYFRFHTQGATLLYTTPPAWVTGTAYVVGDLRAESGVSYYCREAHTSGTFSTDLAAGKWYAMPSSPNIYEIPNPYLETEIFDLHFVQSSDVMTLVHPNHKPSELRRAGATNWQLKDIAFVSALAAPTGLSISKTGTGSTTYRYKVTAVGDVGIDESLPSAEVSTTNDLLTTGNQNTVSWSSVTGAQRYNVYKESSGLFGYIGQTDGLSFKDDNIAADIGRTPPIQNNPFVGAGNYPGAVSYFEQRRAFAGTANKPQNFWMTRSGTESNLSYSLPGQDDDAIQFRVAAREANTIRHIVPLRSLVMLTAAAEWIVTSVNSDAITPTSTSVAPQSFIGANNAQPIIVNNTLIFASARGGHARELAYNWQSGGFLTGDLSLRAPHLFDGYDLTDIAFQKSPVPIAWFVSTSGNLLGFTYVPEQQIGAWHRHDTDGKFESVCCVAEGVEDAVYAVIQRRIGGNDVRYIERMAPRLFGEQENAFFVDSGATYEGAPTSTISGLHWLEGKTVAILGDGAVRPRKTVTGGQITLDQPASVAHVGLPIVADAQTLPLTFEMRGDGALGQARQKNVNKVFLRVYRSSGIFAGPAFDRLTEAKQRTTEPYGSPPVLKSEEVSIMVTPAWTDNGQLCIRQVDPLPLTIVSMSLEVAIGG